MICISPKRYSCVCLVPTAMQPEYVIEIRQKTLFGIFCRQFKIGGKIYVELVY